MSDSELNRVSFLHSSYTPIAWWVHIGAVHALQIWMHPLGIRRISKHQNADQPAKKVRRRTASNCCLCWIAMFGNSLMSKMCLCGRCFVQCYRAYYVIKLLILWSLGRHFSCSCTYINTHTYIYTYVCMYMEYRYHGVLCKYIKLCTYTNPRVSRTINCLCGLATEMSDFLFTIISQIKSFSPKRLTD
jgi:hypothetical protein